MLAEIRTPGWIAVLLALAIFGGAIAIALRSYVNHRRHAADSANWRPGAGSGPKRHDAIQHIGGVGLLERSAAERRSNVPTAMRWMVHGANSKAS